MRKGEVVKLAMVSSCHEVQGSMAHKSFEFVPDMVGDKISSTSTDKIAQVYWTFFLFKRFLKLFWGAYKLVEYQTYDLVTHHMWLACLLHVVPQITLILLEGME